MINKYNLVLKDLLKELGLDYNHSINNENLVLKPTISMRRRNLNDQM